MLPFDVTAWIDDIREVYGRPTEDIVFKLHPGIHRDIILDLDAVANFDTWADNDVRTEITVASDPGASHYVAEMPDLGTKSNFAAAVYNGCWISEVPCCCCMNRDRYDLSM